MRMVSSSEHDAKVDGSLGQACRKLTSLSECMQARGVAYCGYLLTW